MSQVWCWWLDRINQGARDNLTIRSRHRGLRVVGERIAR